MQLLLDQRRPEKASSDLSAKAVPLRRRSPLSQTAPTTHTLEGVPTKADPQSLLKRRVLGREGGGDGDYSPVHINGLTRPRLPSPVPLLHINFNFILGKGEERVSAFLVDFVQRNFVNVLSILVFTKKASGSQQTQEPSALKFQLNSPLDLQLQLQLPDTHVNLQAGLFYSLNLLHAQECEVHHMIMSNQGYIHTPRYTTIQKKFKGWGKGNTCM